MEAYELNNQSTNVTKLDTYEPNAGTKVVMSHSERQEFWRNHPLAKQLGSDKWPSKE